LDFSREIAAQFVLHELRATEGSVPRGPFATR